MLVSLRRCQTIVDVPNCAKGFLRPLHARYTVFLLALGPDELDNSCAFLPLFYVYICSVRV